ncbi:MAG: hypothetical protein COC20_03070 [Cellvibrionales bacterium]|nr:MAG: hypothetical protein COC20_03070 [Cellvibrionales bacterium]
MVPQTDLVIKKFYNKTEQPLLGGKRPPLHERYKLIQLNFRLLGQFKSIIYFDIQISNLLWNNSG